MGSPKVHRRSVTSVSPYHFCTIIAIVLTAASVASCASIGGYARPPRSPAPRSDPTTSIADAHNLISTAAATPSAASDASSTTAALKVCTFKLHRLADAQFDGKITVLMPVSDPTNVRRQAFMFHKLEARFRHAGYTKVNFVIVYEAVAGEAGDAPTPTAMHLPIEDRFERMDSVFNVTVLRSLDATLTQMFVPTAAYVFDQCGRFTYIIYAPWSSIQRPYVKAAILSTIYDEPCGKCETHSSPFPVNVPASVAAVIHLTSSPAPTSSTTDPESISSTSSSTDSAISDSTPNHVDGSSSTTTIAANANPKRNVQFQPIVDETAYVMPIRVIASIEHAHREHFPDATNGSTASNNTVQFYLKYNYIVMRSNDPTYHGHLPTDVPERLALIERPMATDLRTSAAASANQSSSVEDQLADESQKSTTQPLSAATGAPAATELHFITDYGKRYVSLVSASTPSPVEKDGEHRERDNNATPDDQRGQGQTGNPFDVDFVNLEEIPRHNNKQRSNTGRMVTQTLIQFQSVADARADEDVLESNGQEERAVNDHYGKIIQWIQFSL